MQVSSKEEFMVFLFIFPAAAKVRALKKQCIVIQMIINSSDCIT